ncbi:MAG: DUF192 domain-containing protein [Candidatus Pacebacteria bacterium]|nr:DUF192 domain-containing protein [Candidatus Paceibacterota bacterium]
MLNILKNNKTIIFIIILPIFATLLFAIYNQFFSDNKVEKENEAIKVCIEENCFDVEIADTAQEREVGLMNREYLDQSNGMLFVFEEEGVHNFWMKNTLISLDIIWIDENRKIIYIEKNAKPCKIEQCKLFGPDENAKYVLEINGGLTEKTGVGIGNEIELR